LSLRDLYFTGNLCIKFLLSVKFRFVYEMIYDGMRQVLKCKCLYVKPRMSWRFVAVIHPTVQKDIHWTEHDFDL